MVICSQVEKNNDNNNKKDHDNLMPKLHAHI